MGNLRCPINSCPLYKRSSCTPTTENTNIHKFPSKGRYRSFWVDFVCHQNGKNYIPKRNDGLCDSHFEAKWVMPSGRLIMEAKPSIAPLSTRQLLCKWDAATSKIVHIEDQPSRHLPPAEESRESVQARRKAAHLQAQEKTRLKREGIEKEKLVERLRAESVENSELDALCFEDMDDCNSLMEDEQAMEEVAACVPDASSSGHIPSGDSLSALETECSESSLIPEHPKSLDTIANVEQAIVREKRLTLLRYQAGMRRIKGLEVLLKRLQEPLSSVADCSSSESLVFSSSSITHSPVAVLNPPGLTPKFQSKVSSPLRSLLKSSYFLPVSPMSLPPPKTKTKTKTLSEMDLPPPLFDDYH